MELGPLQKKWIADLRAYPERQHLHSLGYITDVDDPSTYTACCLGQAVITHCEHRGVKINVFEEVLIDGSDSQYTMTDNTADSMGFHSADGAFDDSDSLVYVEGNHYNNLMEMNDGGMTWSQIADFVEENPSRVFSIPV